MNNLQEATERICELKGNVMSLDALCTALLQQMAPPARERFRKTFEGWAEIARTALLNAETSEHTIATFERDTQRIGALILAVGGGLLTPDHRTVVTRESQPGAQVPSSRSYS